MKINIATIFDKNYIVRTLAFYNSLIRFGNYTFWFLCLDDETKKIMQSLNLMNVILITIDEMNDSELVATRADRSPGEFTFTAKSVFVNHVMNKIGDGEGLIYADNDVIYFSKPEDILIRMAENKDSIGIVPHNFPDNKKYMEKVGHYNAGLIYFIVDTNSKQCVNEWRKDCINWCYLIEEPERFGDQKYIDKWSKKYMGVYDILDKGINLGSWNISNYKITKRNGVFFVDDEALVCYHFHRIKFYMDRDIVKPQPIYVYHKELYEIYRINLQIALEKMLTVDKNWGYGFAENPGILRSIKQIITRTIRNIKK